MSDDSCVVCGKRAVHTHHRKMRSQGGGDEPSNLLRVCLDDHLWIHANPSEAYARGLLVHSWADPADVDIYLTQQEEMHDSPPVFSGGVLHSIREYPPKPAEGAPCPTCNRRVPHVKKKTTPKSRVWSTRLPLDDTGAETFSELVDAAAEHHGLTSRPYYRYLVLLFGVTMLLQAQKGELPS